MKETALLDSAVFQLTPTRTRCELLILSGGVTEKLASGLLKPFLLHLKTAEEQIEKGGYSIVLEVASGDKKSWFTKGTLQRFVRFVSTPEILERITTIEVEIIQIDESISVQCNEAFFGVVDKPPKSNANSSTEGKNITVDLNLERSIVPFKPRRELANDTQPVSGENSKVQLLKILENRKIVLQKEQGMAYAQATAAGFDNEHMADLVSFAEYFGALRLRKSCLNIMEMYKKKHDAGLWLEEMEMSAMEDNSALSEVSFAGASEFMLSSNSVGQTKIHAASDDPSNIYELKQTAAMQGPNGNYINSSQNRDNGISTSAQVPMGIAGGNENIQQPIMPVWSGQPPQYAQNFQSHMVGSGPPVQGFHGLPVQGIQIGSPYYQSYSGNSYWPQYNPLFHPTQRSESSGMSTDVGSPGSPRSALQSQGLTDQGRHSELDEECEIRPPKTSNRRSFNRSDNKHSGMVVIRNINYITSKEHDGISEKSEPESDSDDEIVIDLSEIKQKNAGAFSRKKGSHNKFSESNNSSDKNGNCEENTDNAGEDDNLSWQVFQTCLLKDSESSQDKPKIDSRSAIHANQQASVEPEMDVEIKEHIITDNSDMQAIFELEAKHGDAGIRSSMSKEPWLLPQRGYATWDEKHAVIGAEREKSSIQKKPAKDDSLIISEQHSEIDQTVRQWDTGDNIEHTISRKDDRLHKGIQHGQYLVDDSFMVSTRSVPQEQANIQWKTEINMDSELPPIVKGDGFSNDVPKIKPETAVSWEPADLLMVPERNTERDSLGQSWHPTIDNDIQELVNIVDQKYPDADLNGDVGAKIILKELPETKSKEEQLKEAEEALAKRKGGTTTRSGKKTKPSPLAEAQLRAEKLRAFKATLLKTKKEKEEEDRKRIEDLKMQRQKRIAGRTNSVGSKSTPNSQNSKQQVGKPKTAGKLSSSMQKDRGSNNLSTVRSLPRPITKISTEAINRLSSHKSKASGDSLSQSVSARVALRKESSNVSKQVRSVVQTKQIPPNIKSNSNQHVQNKKENKENGSMSNVKKSTNQGLNLQQGTEAGDCKTNGTLSSSTPSDNSDLKKKSVVARKSTQSTDTTEGSQEHHQDLNKKLGKQALCSRGEITMDNGVENPKSIKSMDGHASSINNNNFGLQTQGNPQVMKSDSSKKVTEIKYHEKVSVQDHDSRVKEDKTSNSGHFATQKSTFTDVKHPGENKQLTPEDLVDDGFEIIKVSEAYTNSLTEVAKSGSPNSKQLNQQGSFKILSFALERHNPEEDVKVPNAPVSPLNDSPSESFKFCTSNVPATPENDILTEEVFTPRLNTFGSNEPSVISSTPPSASPDLQSINKSSSEKTPVADDDKSDPLNSRKRWGNSQNSAKGLKRFLMFGRKPRNSMSPSPDVVSSMSTTQV